MNRDDESITAELNGGTERLKGLPLKDPGHVSDPAQLSAGERAELNPGDP